MLVLLMVLFVLAGLEGMDARWEDPRPDRWQDATSSHARLRRRGRFAAFLVAARRLRARAEASQADRAHGGSRPARRRGRASASSPDARVSSQPAANEPAR